MRERKMEEAPELLRSEKFLQDGILHFGNGIVIRYLCTYRGTQEPVKIHT